MNYRLTYLPKSGCTCIPVTGRLLFTAVCFLMFSSEAVFSQDEQAEIERTRRLYQTIEWQKGPCTATIAEVAKITVPAGYQFTGQKGLAIWDEIIKNPSSRGAGVLMPVDTASDWFLCFHFYKVGYVSDSEKDQLDADAILNSIRAGTEESNEAQREKGWPELHVDGWIHPPSYDERTNNLVWAIRVKSSDGEFANYDIRFLGRRGVMGVKLVTSPRDLARTVPTINNLLVEFQFLSEEKYSELRAGDNIAKYGLTGLIVTGGTAVAAKTGLLAKLAAFFAKMGKPLFLGLAALAAGILKWMSGKKEG